VSFSIFRLLFNNSEEVKRIRFSQAGFVWVRDCINECRGFVCLGALPSALYGPLFGAEPSSGL